MEQKMIYGKIPPQSIELEEAVLAACLLERDTFEKVMEILYTPECFYLEKHIEIYKAMCELYNSGNVVDLITVTERLNNHKAFNGENVAYYLTTLTMAVSTTAHVVEHSLAVMEKYMKRMVIKICNEATQLAYEGEIDPMQLMDSIESKIKAVSDGILTDNAQSVGNVYNEILTDIQAQKQHKTDLTGVSTGYPDLNSLTNGWQKSELIILAARPSQGKTALALNFALNANTPTLLFSLEASKKALVKRMMAAKNNIPFRFIRQGNLNDFQEAVLTKAISEFHRLPIRIDDKTFSLSAIIKSCRREKKRNPNLGLIIIDYLQLVKVSKMGNREQEVGSISRELKLLASELEVPIIALAQLNRAVEQTANKKPNLSNLRESGSLEQDANIVIFIWHEPTGDNPDGTKQFETWLLVEKNRDGECKPVKMKFNGDIQKWLDANDMNQQTSHPSFLTRDPSEPTNNFNRTEWDEF